MLFFKGSDVLASSSCGKELTNWRRTCRRELIELEGCRINRINRNIRIDRSVELIEVYKLSIALLVRSTYTPRICINSLPETYTCECTNRSIELIKMYELSIALLMRSTCTPRICVNSLPETYTCRMCVLRLPEVY
jgi:hypothetical protein